MKYKLIFTLFNIVIIVSFATIFLLPLLFLGMDYARVFWSENWFVLPIFLVAIAVLNVYFVGNWKVFSFLENEDWEGLKSLLHARIFDRKSLRKSNVRLYINACLVTGDVSGIADLREYLEKEKPSVLRNHALYLGLPFLRDREMPALEEFYGRFQGQRMPDRAWVEWFHAFALFHNGKVDEASEILKGILNRKPGDLKKGLSAYLLGHSRDDADRALSSETAEKLRSKYTMAGWRKQLERQQSAIQVVVLGKLIEDVTSWLFSDAELAPENPAE